jgi:hypothetical protein
MITHAGDTSNLILDPDLDSYYLVDVVLLGLPQAQDRLADALLVAERVLRKAERDLGDSVLLRNVLIYMDEATRRQVLDQLRRVVRGGGYVVLGATEVTFEFDAPWHSVDVDGLRCLKLKE